MTLARHFSTIHYTRILSNGEKNDRKWLLYSKDTDQLFIYLFIYFFVASCLSLNVLNYIY